MKALNDDVKARQAQRQTKELQVKEETEKDAKKESNNRLSY